MRAKTGAMAAMLALGMAAPALAQGPWYVSGSLGGYLRQSDSGADSFFHENDPGDRVGGSDRIGFDHSALTGAVAVGRRLFGRFRVEAELGYTRYAADTLQPSTSAPGFPELNGQVFKRGGGDDYTRFTGEVNGFYDIATLAGRYTPYVGAGVGGSDNHQSQGFFVAADGSPFDTGGGASAQGFAMAEGGLAIALTPRVSLVPAYRYVHYFQGDEDVAHVVKLGVRLNF